MEPIGLMLYGFSVEQSRKIREVMEAVNGRTVSMISGSGREHWKLLDILEDEEGGQAFEEKDDPQVVMFLGFDGPGIHASMDSFPRFEGKKRPIFCTPTEENVEWTLERLLRDLMEEREHFRRLDAERGKA